MKNTFLLALSAVALVAFFTLTASYGNKEPAAEKYKFETSLRMIGHRLLLSADDRKSRILPVEKLSDREYKIRFEHPVALEPDTVISIITRTVRQYALPADYTANVLSCSNDQIVYSFRMSDVEQNIIVPCLGRTLPKGCYYINIHFPPPAGTPLRNYMMTGLLMLGAAGLILFFRKRKPPVVETGIDSPREDIIRIGGFHFDHHQRSLEIGGEKIELTSKEAKLLHLFSLSPNKTIDREELQKEVWENEGVIVTRSLDVFISRLRKKLEKDPSVKLINVHGKGYVLQFKAP